MQVVKGIPVSPGIAIGEAFVIGREDVRIEKASTRGADAEVARYEAARTAAAGQIRAFGAAAGPEGQGILEAHVQLVEDSVVRREIEQRIRSEATTAEYAVSTAYGARAEKMRKMADEYFASRAEDIRHVESRILRALLGAQREDLRHLAHDVILVAHELSPADTAGLALTGGRIRGLATEVGGKTSHTAIVAREHGLPAIVGAEGILTEVAGGDLLVLDGAAGRVLVNPDPESLQSWREREQAYLSQKEGTRRAVRRVPSETPDGHRILLLANVDGPAEVASAVALGADGVGLFRTEFLVKGSQVPSEDEQYAVYRAAVAALGDRPLTIRTFDFGADKVAVGDGAGREPNPFLGFRSIRYCLQNLKLFKSQLRAILRASAHGPVRLMFPMVSAVEEVRRARLVVSETREALRREGIAFDERMPVGIMIEIPSAAVVADLLAESVDFFSIGTNDLVGYTLAVDRGNERVASLYRPGHPAVLRMIRDVIAVGREHGVSVSMCGEICGDLTFTILLLGLGLREFSLAPALIPDVKLVVRSIGLRVAEEVAERVFAFREAAQIEAHLEERTRRLVPEAF